MQETQQLLDRAAISTVLAEYSNAIDTRDFEALDRVFTPDAFIDYTAMGGIQGPYPDIKRWLSEVLANFPAYYHLLGQSHIRLDGDSATSRTACFNPMQVGEQVMFLGLWYIDDWRRTDDGWRITRRSEEKCFDHNTPDAFKQIVK